MQGVPKKSQYEEKCNTFKKIIFFVNKKKIYRIAIFCKHIQMYLIYLGCICGKAFGVIHITTFQMHSFNYV